MRKIIAGLGLIVLTTGIAEARDTYTRGYERRDGTYVQPHYSTRPDATPYNNYSTQGNTNPYTGKVGTVDPYAPKPLYAPSPWK